MKNISTQIIDISGCHIRIWSVSYPDPIFTDFLLTFPFSYDIVVATIEEKKQYENQREIKLHTVNVIELEIDDNVIEGVRSFADTLKGNKAAEKLFTKLCHENHDARLGKLDKDDIIKVLQKESCFQFSMGNANWHWNDDYYWYNGTGRTTTKMTTVVLFKE